MIKQNVNFSMFLDSFSDTYRHNFTYEGKRALFDYLEDYSESTGEDVELDIIALCCEYTEYENLEELRCDYTEYENLEELRCDYTEYENLEELQGNYSSIETMEDLENKTQVIRFNDSKALIIQNF